MTDTDNGETPYYNINSQLTPSSNDKTPNVNKQSSSSPKNKMCRRYDSHCFYKWFLVIIYILFIIYGIIILVLASKNKTNKCIEEAPRYNWFIVSLIIYEICDIISLLMFLFTDYESHNTFGYKILVKFIIPCEMVYYMFYIVVTGLVMYYYKSPYYEIIESFLLLSFAFRLVQFVIQFKYLNMSSELCRTYPTINE